MRFSTALIGVTSAVLAGTGTAFPQGEWQQPGHEEERRKDVKEFVRLELEEPLNWVPSERLMGEVLDSLIENPNTYNGEEMARITLHLCTEFYENTTATLSYIASDPTRPGQKWWYGYCFGGAPATAADFVRQPGVEHSIAYTSDIISDRVVRANQASHSQLQKRHTPDDFVPIKLEKPFNWVPTLALEARVFESIEKPEGWYVDPGTFAQEMLSLCTEDHPDDLTATFTVLKKSAVHPEGLWWTGYCIGGGPLTQADLERELGAGYSIGYTLKANDGAVKRGQPRREESERRDVKGFVRPDLQEPLNWVPGYELLTHVIGEFIADQDQFDAESFASYVLTKCTTKYPDTTATSTYLLKLPYEPDKKYWFGWCYGKDVATPDDFVRRDGVEYSFAYSSGVNSPAVKREQPGREESERRDAKGFVRLDLPEPLNWVPGEELLTYIIDQYLETRDSYDADSFALYVLTECTTKHTDATGTATWLLPLADEPATEARFGICFGKHVPAPDDFVRREGAEYSIAYASGVNSRAVKREQAGHELGQRQDGNGRPGQEQWQRRDEHEQPGRDESLSRIKEYRRVQLEEPLNWEPGEGLIFGHNILDTYYGNDVDKYNQDSFSRWVMDNCNVDHPNTTSTFSLLTSDGFDPVNYFWEGYCFGGPPATVADYDRADDVSHSIAYTTALEDSAVKEEQPGRDERPGGHLPEDFVRVEFEDPVDPTRWIEGPALASQSLAMFYADFNDTDAESFANYVLNRCSYGYEQSVSTLTYLRIFAWADSPRVWIGHCFGGNPTSQADYQRYDWVEYTIAYTLKAKEVQPGRNLRQRQVPGQEEWQRRDVSDLVRRKQEEQSGRQQQHELLADVDDFVRVKLDEPLNWTPSPDLIRTHGIGSVTEDEALYDAESFARYTLAYCARFTGCTSTASYLRSFPHVTTNKTWYGHCFWGPPTTQADYVREDWSEHSIVYTISTTPKFVRLELEEPSNWVAGPRLWPNQVLDGYQAAIDKYDTELWASYVLDRCTKEQTICTSTASYSDYIEDHKYRAWIGYCFGGGPTNQSDYVRRDGVDQSVIYTIGEKQPRREEEPEREQFQRRDLEKRQQQQGDDSWGPRNARDFLRRPDQEQRTGHEQLQSRDKGDFVRLDLEQPLDWAPGLGLFMTGVIDMTHASLDLYDQDSWAELVLNLCLQWAYCNSTISYSGFLPESPNTRVWVGLLFYGGPTKQADYERLGWVQHSVVYTIKEGQPHRRQEQQPGREQWQQRRDETERPGPQQWQRRDGYEQPGRDEWQQRDESDFKRLELDWPHNWQPGYRLWQRGILDGAEGEIPEYDEDSWAELVLGICSKHADCTSSVTYAGFYPSDPDRRVWLGYCFGGAQTTQADYERSDKVEQSVVYTRPE